MSVLSHLTTTVSNLVLTSSERSSISTSVSTLETRLENWFQGNVTEKFKFGSFPRWTILPRKVDSDSDVDYMVVFDNSDNKKPQTYLDRLKKFAEKKYTTSEISQSHPTIVLELNHIRFELVPAYSWYLNGYYIPKKWNRWDERIYSDPQQIEKELTNKNTSNGSQIIPLVRLLKYWNASKWHIYSSYGLEKYIIDKHYSSVNLKEMLYSVVDWIGTGHLSERNASKVNTLKNIVNKTREFENNFDVESAESEIKKAFPVY